MAAILTTSGRIAIATAIKARTAHLAWGSGSTGWGNTPPDPPANSTALVAEVARRKANQVDFCTPASNGAISVPDGRFNTTTPAPLPHRIRFPDGSTRTDAIPWPQPPFSSY